MIVMLNLRSRPHKGGCKFKNLEVFSVTKKNLAKVDDALNWKKKHMSGTVLDHSQDTAVTVQIEAVELWVFNKMQKTTQK